jgi:hypothetical protein
MKLGMYIMAPESISTAYFINSSHQSLCIYVYPPIVAKQQLGKHVPTAKNTRNNRRIVGVVVFCTVRVVSKDSLQICVSLLSNGSVYNVPAATKNCWRCRFLCCPCRIEGKHVISSSQNFLFAPSHLRFAVWEKWGWIERRTDGQTDGYTFYECIYGLS